MARGHPEGNEGEGSPRLEALGTRVGGARGYAPSLLRTPSSGRHGTQRCWPAMKASVT